MERKYKVTAAQTIMPMSITFRKVDSDEFHTISVGVNYAQDQVVFNGEKILEIDYEDLEQEILAQLRPATIDMPNIPPDIFERVAKMRSGEYQSAFNMPEVGK